LIVSFQIPGMDDAILRVSVWNPYSRTGRIVRLIFGSCYEYLTEWVMICVST